MCGVVVSPLWELYNFRTTIVQQKYQIVQFLPKFEEDKFEDFLEKCLSER